MQIHYFPIRGLAEMIRITLCLAGVEWEDVPIDYKQMKEDIDTYPFAQCPRLQDGDVSLCHSQAIVRYLGRKFELYGASEKDRAFIDEFLEGIAALRKYYLELVYTHQMEQDKKAAHWSQHADTGSLGQRNGGAHWAYLSRLLKRNAANGAGPVVGQSLSIADAVLYDITSLYLRVFENEMRSTYPEVVAHHDMVAGQKGVRAYLQSGRQPEKVNGNNMG